MKIPEELYSFPFPAYLISFSALDNYFRMEPPGQFDVLTEGTLVDLAKHFDEIDYPGIEGYDGIVTTEEGTIRFVCADQGPAHPGGRVFSVLSLLYDFRRNAFLDQRDIYRDLRKDGLVVLDTPLRTDWKAIAEGAVLSSRYGYNTVPDIGLPDAAAPKLSPLEQRDLCILLLTSDRPWMGLEHLYRSGFVHHHWPELSGLEEIQQGKSHHPEGNVLQHTLETFKYRKTNDLILSLSLLLHDIGKKISNKQGDSRFHLHSIQSVSLGERFMRRLGFSREVIEKVSFLVKHHMLPGALPKLPPYRVEKTLSSPLFPMLLELYRCDLHSTFRGPEGYYRACKAYRVFLKHRKNPFRDAAGKKMFRLYVE